MCDIMKTGGLSLEFENFIVIITALSNEESLCTFSNFSTSKISRNGITTFNGCFNY